MSEEREGTAQLGRTCAGAGAMWTALLLVAAALVRRMR